MGAPKGNRNAVGNTGAGSVSKSNSIAPDSTTSPDSTSDSTSNPDSRLTPRQEMFCQEYIKDLNATQAVIRAGYNHSTLKSAAAMGSGLLANRKVRARVEELKAERIQRVRVEQDDVLSELLILLKSNIDHYKADPDTGTLTLADGIDPTAMRAVSGVKVKARKRSGNWGEVEEKEIEYKLWPKDRAVEMGMKHLGLMTDRLKIEDPDGVLAGILGVKKEDLPE